MKLASLDTIPGSENPIRLKYISRIIVKTLLRGLIFSISLLTVSCVTQFIPETTEDPEILVVEGLITDQPGSNYIRLSKSLPLGGINSVKPLEGCNVTISDDRGNSYRLSETSAGNYEANFQGVAGVSYTLHIITNDPNINRTYQSFPVEMKPVPPVDSLFYEKVIIKENFIGSMPAEGCQIYLNTHDPGNNCKFYRWEYTETWEFRLPYLVPNNRCWISNNSDRINIKSTSSLEENRINRHPLNFVSNQTDRLRERYSVLVNQYSLSEDEYIYWEKLQNFTEKTGGLYDITPASISGNIWCVEDPDEKVLGYFSVSACSSKRIFIKDRFLGVTTPYTDRVCVADTIFGYGEIPDLGVYTWVIDNHPFPPPGYRVITKVKGCYDCTLRGTNIEPVFWQEDKNNIQNFAK